MCFSRLYNTPLVGGSFPHRDFVNTLTSWHYPCYDRPLEARSPHRSFYVAPGSSADNMANAPRFRFAWPTLLFGGKDASLQEEKGRF